MKSGIVGHIKLTIPVSRLRLVLSFTRKGAVSVISSDPPCKDDNARFIKVPLKALSDQV